ncbi:MAG: cation acetate symporter, partial [Pirellulaceae bacterium]|nr:cation acetate symporter [Pirellulaceae bacterium]
SVFYLIPQMVGAGVLVTPLLGLPHAAGVVLVGAIVILIVVTAGMVSTTYVQFLKGALLVVFSTLLTVMILARGFEVAANSDKSSILEPQTVTVAADGTKTVNGKPQGTGSGEGDLRPIGHVSKLPGGVQKSGPQGPFQFFRTLSESEVVVWKSSKSTAPDGVVTTTYNPETRPGSELLRAGNHPNFRGLRGDNFTTKLNFLSLMLALFCGTASLPHILIRYYTVKDQASARKSTIVGIATIGFFYVLTLYMGLGAMTSGAMDVTNSNMAAPLLAKSFSNWLFAIISAIAFTTVLGTVSGLIIASSGAVAHDLMGVVYGKEINEDSKVRIGKIASVVVGAAAIILGILFEKMNVSYLVGWAFSVAASANLPALVMVLFWKRCTRYGITASVLVGMITSLGWILLSGDTFKNVYNIDPDLAPVPFSQPGLVTIPLSFLVLVVVSLMTPAETEQAPGKPSK